MIKGLGAHLVYSQKTNRFIDQLPQYPLDLISESYSMFHTSLLAPSANSDSEQGFVHHIGLAIDRPNSALFTLSCFKIQ